jgi:hypothetical protein
LSLALHPAVVTDASSEQTRRTVWSVVLLLAAVLFAGGMIRTVFSPLQEAAKLDLKLSDFAISLVHRHRRAGRAGIDPAGLGDRPRPPGKAAGLPVRDLRDRRRLDRLRHRPGVAGGLHPGDAQRTEKRHRVALKIQRKNRRFKR